MCSFQFRTCKYIQAKRETNKRTAVRQNMNEYRAMSKNFVSITRQKYSLNVMKPSSHKMLENL